MPIEDIVSVNVSLSTPPLARASFGIPLVISEATAGQISAFGGDRTVELSPSSWATTLASLGFAAGNPGYDHVAIMMANPGPVGLPAKVVFGYAASSSWAAQVDTVAITTEADGVWTLTVNGQSVTYTAAGSATIETIRDGLVSAVNAATWGLVDPTTGTVSTHTLTLTAPAAGLRMVTTITPPAGGVATVTTTTPNTSIAADLAAIEAERADWYHIATTYETPGVVLSLDAAVASFGRPVILHARSHAAGVQATAYGSATDIAHRFDVLARQRTATWWHAASAQYVDAAILGHMGAVDPGTLTFANRRLAGLDANVITSTTNLKAKHACYAETVANRLYSRKGWLANGNYIDSRIAADHLANDLQLALLEKLASAQPPTFDEDGRWAIAGIIEGAIRSKAYVGPDSVSVNVPPRSSLPSGDQANRHWSGITFTADLRGFAHSITVNGELVE